MDHAERIRARREKFQIRRGLRFGDFFFKIFQRPPDESAQPALRQAFRQRINRRNAVDVDETFLAALDTSVSG